MVTIANLLSVINGTLEIDRTSLPLHLYLASEARALSNYQLAHIMVPQKPDPNGNNVFCRECEQTFKSTIQSNGVYFKRDNLVKHLINKHRKEIGQITDDQSTFPPSFFDKQTTYFI